MQNVSPWNNFLHLDLGNLVTWGIVVLGWYTAYIRQNQLNLDKFNSIQKWIDFHEKESGERDKLLSQLVKITTQSEKAAEAISKLADIAESRIRRLENIYFYPSSRPPTEK